MLYAATACLKVSAPFYTEWNSDLLMLLGVSAESIPYLVRRVVEVRDVLEKFSAETQEDSTLLNEAYGQRLFKCPIVDCVSFHQGFRFRQHRDKHLDRHQRSYKCEHEGCDYGELGFPIESDLRSHVKLCHSVLPEEVIFPRVQSISLSKALNDAIDRDDECAVRDICYEIPLCPLQETGFLLRAVKRRSIMVALALVRLLGTDTELNHRDVRGRTALHEAVLIEHDELLNRILSTRIDVNAPDKDGCTPILIALKNGCLRAARLLMNHGAIVATGHETGFTRKYFETGMKNAAAGGENDIIKVLFPIFVDLCKPAEDLVNRGIKRIVAEAASRGHESTVIMILEMIRAQGLEKSYDGLLRKDLPRGIEVMTTFLMSHYGKAKCEVDKAGKTYGNALAKAALGDDFALVLRLLESGADINYADKHLAYNALGAACSRGKLSMVDLLLKQGADVNAEGGYKGTALCLACSNRNMTIVDLLFEKGANVNARGVHGITALSSASDEGHLSVVKLLFEKGAAVNSLTSNGESALMKASSGGHSGIVQFLSRLGADINLQDCLQETALHKACTRGNKDVVQMLIGAGADVNLQDCRQETALHEACTQENKDIVQMLIGAGADVNEMSSPGETLFFKAVIMDRIALLQVLIDMGADIDVRDRHCQTALTASCSMGRLGIVRILLSAGASDQQAALDAASKNGHEEIVLLLLEQGADLAFLDKNGRKSALVAASKIGREDLVQSQLTLGTDINLQDSSQATALFAASERGHLEVVRTLVANGADINLHNDTSETPLYAASESGHVEIVRMLLAEGADLNSHSDEKQTPLYIASDRGHTEIVRLLLAEGADIRFQSHSKKTPLFISCKRGHVETARILLAAGADVSTRNDLQQTALYVASYSGHGVIVKLLLDNGDEVLAKGGAYDIALSMACSIGLENTVLLLLEAGKGRDIPSEVYYRALTTIPSHAYPSEIDRRAIAEILRWKLETPDLAPTAATNASASTGEMEPFSVSYSIRDAILAQDVTYTPAHYNWPWVAVLAVLSLCAGSSRA